MKKSMRKGFVTGCCMALVTTFTTAFSIPVIAHLADANIGSNLFRIRNTLETIYEWGQPYTHNSGREVPVSITYDGEMYLHIDLVSEAFGNYFQWNGDSSTLTVLGFNQSEAVVLAERVEYDFQGNLWCYRILKHESDVYLFVEDNIRGYARAYKIENELSFEFAEDSVYFTVGKSGTEPSGRIYNYLELIKITYLNNPDNQDGEVIYAFHPGHRNRYNSPVIFDGVMYYVRLSYAASYIPHSYSFIAVDCGNPENGLELLDFAMYGSTAVKIDSVHDGYIIFRLLPGPLHENYIPTDKYYKMAIDGAGEAIELSLLEYLTILKEI